MKLSVSLTDEDVALVDEYLSGSGLKSRSAVIRRALRLLRQTDLAEDYASAWEEWASSGEEEAWESTAADGLADAPR
jgi:Arc/MetJ-type ribon-helix-helix transcriptional regulator